MCVWGGGGREGGGGRGEGSLSFLITVSRTSQSSYNQDINSGPKCSELRREVSILNNTDGVHCGGIVLYSECSWSVAIVTGQIILKHIEMGKSVQGYGVPCSNRN